MAPDSNDPFLGPVLVCAQLRLPTHPQGQLLRPPGLSAHLQVGVQLRMRTASLRTLLSSGYVPVQAAHRLIRVPGAPLQLPHLSAQQHKCLRGLMYCHAHRGSLWREPAAGLVSAAQAP